MNNNSKSTRMNHQFKLNSIKIYFIPFFDDIQFINNRTNSNENLINSNKYIKLIMIAIKRKEKKTK